MITVVEVYRVAAVRYGRVGMCKLQRGYQSTEWKPCSARYDSTRCDLLKRGKSGLHRTQWWVTPTVREDRESATENIPPDQYPLVLYRRGLRGTGKGEMVR